MADKQKDEPTAAPPDDTAASKSSSEAEAKAEKKEEKAVVKKSNRSGIPQAAFVVDVDEYMKSPENQSAEVVLRRLDEQHSKYKFLEANLQQKKKRLRVQIPEIKKSLELVQFLKDKKEAFSTNFLLSDTLYGTADIEPVDSVCLWLGANVMLEYPIDDAIAMLSKNLENARTSLKDVEEDMNFTLDQCTTVEVAMSRVYNWDVKERREKKQAASST